MHSKILIIICLLSLFCGVSEATKLVVRKLEEEINVVSGAPYASFWDALRNLDLEGTEVVGLLVSEEQRAFAQAFGALVYGDIFQGEQGFGIPSGGCPGS